ncbi:helix-turn-helix domain-containing protein [Mycobacterium colombiense]|uniref:helix-turn-helix domain-containing protein n=1 Tax=Mycobacterium colombiense TaxID=339268 RepID=UPI00096F7FB0|nr:helix-turn-helix domain-containing protein [Mycobacterium colombiense]
MPNTNRFGDPTIAEAAEILNVSKQFVRRRIADHTLPAYRLKGSRLIRIRREDLDALKVPVGSAG